jgi:hypothetical protein
MVASGKNDQQDENLPNFSDPEDYVDDISNEGMCFVSYKINKSKITNK